MKKLICMILTLVMVLSLAACGSKETASVSTDGSTSMQKVISALGEAFMEDIGANFTYNATGSGNGIKAVKDGTCDIGLSSRYLKDSEKAEGLQETILAIDGIATIVHTDNTVADLTVEQIAAIFKGEITNWSEVGGKDGEIVCIGREESSGTRDGFESITDTGDACAYRQELTSNGAVLTTVAENPNAIGYVSLSSVKDTVKAISVSGVAPSEATIKDGSYAVLRRCKPKASSKALKLDGLVLNLGEHTVTVDGERVVLTYKEYELLHLFLSQPGIAFTREQLLSTVWNTEYLGETRTVDMHIRTLRQKLGSYGHIIETVRNVGYRLERGYDK